MANESLRKNVTVASFYSKFKGKSHTFQIFDENSSFTFPSILSELGIKNDLIETMEKINQFEKERTEKSTKYCYLCCLCLPICKRYTFNFWYQ